MELTLRKREVILQKVNTLVGKKHFNPALRGANWPALFEEHKARILEREKPEDFEKEVNELLSELKTSHTGFMRRGGGSIPARLAINATFQRCNILGTERWMFEDIHDGGPAQKAGIEPGDILLRVGGVEIAPPTPVVFKMGTPIEVAVSKRDGREVILAINPPAPKSKKRPISQPHPVSFSKLTGNIGFLKITMFPGAVGVELARDIDRAISSLSGCERLIVDLRGNTGGGIGGLRLMSYLAPCRWATA